MLPKFVSGGTDFDGWTFGELGVLAKSVLMQAGFWLVGGQSDNSSLWCCWAMVKV
tara:strand:- start:881 stop:1045 length:165 start_codon:yes stop_codon:yes gene_type:complete